MNQSTSSQEVTIPVAVPTSPPPHVGGRAVTRSNNKKNGKPTKPAGIPIFIRSANPPSESDLPVLNMNPANQEPQPLDELQASKESHAQESCKLTSLQAEVMLMKSSLAEMLDMMKKRSPSHQAESPITSEEDHEEDHGVLFLKETTASGKDVRDGYSTSSSSSSTSSSSTSYDIPSRARTASIALKNGASMARDTFLTAQAYKLPMLWLIHS